MPFGTLGTTTGTTTSRTQLSPLDQEAIGTSDKARLQELCRLGSKLGCQYAGEPEPSAGYLEQMAATRDADAIAQRETTAKKLETVGVNPRIVESVRLGRDVIYAKDIEEAERTVREAEARGELPIGMADDILTDFYEFHTPWYKRTKTLVIAAAIVATGLLVVAFR